MAEDKQLIMQLLNMFAQQMGNIGQQRQQARQARAQMAAEQQRMAQQKQLAMAQLAQGAEDLKLKNEFQKAQLEDMKITAGFNKLRMQSAEQEAKWKVAQEEHPETIQQFTENVAKEPFKGIKDLGPISQALGLLKNVPATIQTAAAGPQMQPGMTEGQFIQSEAGKGVPYAAMGGLTAKEELTPFEQEMQKLQMQFMKGQITAQQYGARLSEMELPLAEYRAAHPEWMEPGYGYPRGGGYGSGGGGFGGTPTTPEPTALSPEQQYQQDADVLTRAGELGEEDLAAQVDSMIEYYKGNYSAGNASKEELVALAASYGWTFNPADYSVADIFDGLRDHLIQRFRYKKPEEAGKKRVPLEVEEALPSKGSPGRMY